MVAELRARNDDRLWLGNELWRLLRQLMPTSIALSLPLMVVAASLQWGTVPYWSVLTWCGLMVIVSCARLLLYRTRPAAEAVAGIGQRMRWHRLGCMLAGAGWASSALFLWAAGNPVAQLLLIFVLAGVTAAAAGSLAADFPAALCFELPVFAALLLRLAHEGGPRALQMAAAVLLYLAFISHSARRTGDNIAENLRLRLRAMKRELVLEQSEARFRHLAQVDALTGLSNRYAMQALVPAMLSAAAERGSLVAVLYIDLDDFKDVNDTRGHGCGDQLLQRVADRLRGAVGGDDSVFRMGGDEFIVVTTRAESREAVEQLARRVLAALAAPLRLEGHDATVGASIGIGLYPEDGVDVGALLKHADVALYQAKAQGRSTFRFYSTGQSQAIADRLELEAALVRAIDAEELFLEYQPLVDIASGDIVGFEALARWHHPERGMIPPATFIGAAERCGRIHALGELVLRLLCRQLRDWREEFLTVLPVAINVSPRQFDGGGFLDRFTEITAAHGIEPELVEVEVTESALMSRGAGHHDVLDALRHQGVRISIDDFGTGYSSLSYLKHLPVASVKIDRSFVRDMLSDPRDAAIVNAIIDIGHSLDLRVVAEGVETQSQLRQLRLLGCDVAQGYVHHRPLSASQAGALIAAAARRPLSPAATLEPARDRSPVILRSHA